ncbi:PPC domain-containing protein [Scytonema millei]|uniref:Pre-peptidase n=1 Tax=Scytonema millei VB511283 TaxID=1245923 RepID=A0A9X5E790_9CYAN|nr:PPC domain-containing protein [Scytonema millei]NHC35494.1 pre-peptidase [Scytonema millei VB511283]
MILKAVVVRVSQVFIPATCVAIAMGMSAVVAQCSQCKLYNPITLPASNQIDDTLSEKDIPTGQGGFARDYVMEFKEGESVAIDLASESFDAILTLLAEDGSTVAENDDGPDGSNNALLFTRIAKTGRYIVRVRAFGETGVGNFRLKVTRLQPVSSERSNPLIPKLRQFLK